MELDLELKCLSLIANRSNQCIRPFIFGMLLEKLLTGPVCRGAVSRKTAFLNCGFPLLLVPILSWFRQCVEIIQLPCSSNVLLETCFAWSKEVLFPAYTAQYLFIGKCTASRSQTNLENVFNILPLVRTTEYAVILEEIVHKKNLIRGNCHQEA